MKTRSPFLLFRGFIFLLSAVVPLLCLSQVADRNEIDPRRYVTVIYKKFPTSKVSDTIFSWRDNPVIPFQRYSFLNTDGIISLHFDRSALSKDKEFEGTLSLEAEISGPGGTRKIEVNPYSEIGAQRIPVGIKSEPPAELVRRLLNLVIEMSDTEPLLIDWSWFDYKIWEYTKTRSYRIKMDSTGPCTDDTTCRKARDLLIDIKKNFDSVSLKPFRTKEVINDELARKRTLLYEAEKEFLANINDAFLPLQRKLKFKLDLILDYFQTFDQAGLDATKAFFSIINKDYVVYEHLKERFSLYRNSINVDGLSADLSNEPEFKKAVRELIHLQNDIAGFSEMRNSKLSRIAEKLDNKLKAKNISSDYHGYRSLLSKVIKEQYEAFVDSVSRIAAGVIYKNLVFGTVDIAKSGGAANETLNLYLIWIRDSRKDSAGNSPRLPLGRYYLRKTGWQLDVSDMFSLVQRIDASFDTSGSVSPSHFKGSGGATLMWTYHKEDRGVTVKNKQDGSVSFHKRNRLMNFLEPSLGVNVSYLDFRTDRDVEIGTGLQLGFFRNKIFFGSGVNLHLLRPDDVSPYYFFLGFSFAKLSDMFRDPGKISSAP